MVGPGGRGQGGGGRGQWDRVGVGPGVVGGQGVGSRCHLIDRLPKLWLLHLVFLCTFSDKNV